MAAIKDIRLEKKLTQKQVASMVGISLRSYKSYENDISKRNSLKYNYILDSLTKYNPIDEEHGILSVDDIADQINPILKKYNVQFCFLFGSYAKGKAKETSDVDLLISTETTGLRYYGMVEEIRNLLHKRIDALDISQLKDNLSLTEEILKDGIKIYG